MTAAKSIYIHLPFCKTKCPYCDFASFTEQSKELHKNYLKTLIHEIEERVRISPPKAKIKTVFFGGGTPSIHSSEEIELILNKLNSLFSFEDDPEITLEANPGTINLDKLKRFQDCGINRISIGVQSFDEKLLNKLGRGHSLADSYQAIEDIVKLKFSSWSLDLIYGLPGQTIGSWEDTIKEAIKYKAPHISAYALSIEKNTPYGKIYGDSSHQDLPIENDLVEMYKLVNKKLAEEQLHRYEISNWSKENHEAKHNLTYWNALEYYAFGLSAHGYTNGYRYSNTRDLSKYLELHKHKTDYIEDNKEFISKDENYEEQILLKMRLSSGISLNSDLSKMINKDELNKYLKAGFIEKISPDNVIKLSVDGALVSNKIIADLIK